MALAENDLAILTARFGCARFGASRFGFIPCPEDVHGTGAEEPGEYIWKEVKPPTTQWQLITEDCVCGQAPVAGFTMTGENLCTLALSNIVFDYGVFLSPTTGEQFLMEFDISGAAVDVLQTTTITWDDGSPDDGDTDTGSAVTEAWDYTHTYAAAGSYDVTIHIVDENGCSDTIGTTIVVADIPELFSTVEGHVMIDLFTPVNGEDVTMTVDAVPWPGGPVATDVDGFYQFLSVPAGVIFVSVAATGLHSDGDSTDTTVPPATLTLDIAVQGL